MLTNSKIALSLALVLAAASAATAAPKQPARPNTAIAGSHLSLDSVSPAGSVAKPSNISPRGYDRLKRLMEDFQDLGS
jgi:hypothetical protein